MTDNNGGLMPVMAVFPVIKAYASQSSLPAETTARVKRAPVARAQRSGSWPNGGARARDDRRERPGHNGHRVKTKSDST